MKLIRAALAILFVLGAGPALAADHPLVVGIVPFDVASVDGTGPAASASLAKLIRIQIIRNHAVRPELITPPPGTQTPIADDQATALGRTAHADIVLVGTVLDASTSESSHGASTGSLLSGLGANIGGRLDRVTAHVSLHVDLIDVAAGKLVDSFEVEGKKSQTGIGADLSTTLGGFDSGDNAWANTPMGKALQDAAEKVASELAKRAPKLQK